ncbi:MAG TPA: hypothetical protein VKV27_14335 [Solirubrobacteraceae bacterium]|nr:hypothetical protein [Solirubrobacteraceae bacterium]
MAYTTAEGRERILADLAAATERIAEALTLLGEAYEHLDDELADRLQELLFRPTQAAYARAQRAHASFAQRSGLQAHGRAATVRPAPSHGVRELIEAAAQAVQDADRLIGELQDSMLPVEVGDPELRAGLASVREALDRVPELAQGLIRLVGR